MCVISCISATVLCLLPCHCAPVARGWCSLPQSACPPSCSRCSETPQASTGLHRHSPSGDIAKSPLPTASLLASSWKYLRGWENLLQIYKVSKLGEENGPVLSMSHEKRSTLVGCLAELRSLISPHISSRTAPQRAD